MIRSIAALAALSHESHSIGIGDNERNRTGSLQGASDGRKCKWGFQHWQKLREGTLHDAKRGGPVYKALAFAQNLLSPAPF